MPPSFGEYVLGSRLVAESRSNDEDARGLGGAPKPTATRLPFGGGEARRAKIKLGVESASYERLDS